MDGMCMEEAWIYILGVGKCKSLDRTQEFTFRTKKWNRSYDYDVIGGGEPRFCYTINIRGVSFDTYATMGMPYGLRLYTNEPHRGTVQVAHYSN